MCLEDKVAVVTWSGSGTDRPVVTRFASDDVEGICHCHISKPTYDYP